MHTLLNELGLGEFVRVFVENKRRTADRLDATLSHDHLTREPQPATPHHEQGSQPATLQHDQGSQPATLQHEQESQPATLQHEQGSQPSTPEHDQGSQTATPQLEQGSEPATLQHEKEQEPATLQHEQEPEPATLQHEQEPEPATPELEHALEIDSDNDEDFQSAIRASLGYEIPQPSTEAVLKMWVASTLVSSDFADEQEILIHRRRVLESTQRAIARGGFQLKRPFRVQFSGEEAEDYGGPRREFLCNLLKEVSQCMFEGADGYKTCIHSVAKLEKEMFKFAGKVVAWSILHGGPAFPIFSPPFVRLMIGENAAELSLNDVNDVDVKEKILRVNVASDEDILNMSDWLMDAGLGPVQIPLTLDTRNQMRQQLIKNHVFLRVHAEIAQFTEGLDSLGGFYKQMKRHPDALLPLFTPSSEKLTSRTLKSMYTANMKEVGHNCRQEEEDTLYSFECFLQECDAESFPVAVTDVLAFWTGSESVPPLGFHKGLEVDFVPNNDKGNRLPVAHTCNLSLELPRGVQEPDAMIRLMEIAIGWGGEFHLA